MLHQIHPNKIRQFLFLAVLIVIGALILREMAFMLGAFLGAITLYVLLRNWMIHLVLRRGWKKWLAALTLMLLSLIVLVVPVAWMLSVAYDKLMPVIQNPSIVTQVFERIHQYVLQQWQVDIFNGQNVSKVSTQVMPLLENTIGGTLSSLGNLFIMYLLLYFMLTATMDMELWLRNHVPFKHSNVQKVMAEVRGMVFSNALGIPIVALLQGLVGMIGYWMFGVHEFILMGLLTAVCSVVPIVGSMLVYIPLMIYQMAIGFEWQGIAIGLWGFILIGSIDNVARFMLQKQMANVHPLITLFGVFIGINLIGFLGIIFGPLLLSMFMLLVKIYIDEFGKADADQLPPVST
jgi:predicted PurR-regulated permease PerM